MYNGYIWQTTFKIKCTKNLSLMVQMWMVYKHKNVHTIIKASVWQFFADLIAFWEKTLESPWWSSLRKKERDRFNVMEEGQFEDFTGWKCKHGGTSRITKRNWLDGEEECSCRISLHLKLQKCKKCTRQKNDLKNPVLQYVPCQGNMEHNWMYGGEEGHWRISLVRKKKK